MSRNEADDQKGLLTRRQFISGAASWLGLWATERLGLGRTITRVKTDEPYIRIGEDYILPEARAEAAATEAVVDLPPNTFLFGRPAWIYKAKGVPVEILEKFNGPQSTWGAQGGITLLPSTHADGKTGTDWLAKEKLNESVYFRADTTRDKETDEGWDKEDQALIQGLLPVAVKRNEEFFGKPWYRGFVRVTRPSASKREELRSQIVEPIGGAVAAANSGKPGALQVFMLETTNTYTEKFPGIPMKKIVGDYVRMTRGLLTHEIGHVWFLGTKLGSRLDNHSIVRTLECSGGLIDLLGKSREQLNKVEGYNDLDRPEMLLWKIFKVKGIEIYAEIIKGLTNKYGYSNKEFTDEQMKEVIDPLFEKAGFNFTFDQLIDSHKKVPNEKNIPSRTTNGYTYETGKLEGDQYNPDGVVSWWIEVPSLSPVPITEKGWSSALDYEPFPDQNGYYWNRKFIGNGKLKDGPPNGNSLAVASWKKGGWFSGSDIFFPIGMPGVEVIRAKMK